MKKFYTLKEIDKLTTEQLREMTTEQLSKIVSSERSVARKRIERIEAAEVYSPAYAGIMRAGGIPTVKGMDKVTLLNEHKKYQTFLSAATSTKSGASKYQRTIEKNIKDAVTDTLQFPDEAEKKQFINELDDFMKDNAGIIYQTLDWYRDRNYTAFVNYRAIVGKIAQKMMMGYGKGNRGAFLAGLKRELDKEYAEAKRVYESTTPSDFIEG